MTQPKAKLRDKNIKLTIWENQSDKGIRYYRSNLTKSYKDDAGEWQETTNLNSDDLLKASNLLKQGYNKILDLKSE